MSAPAIRPDWWTPEDVLSRLEGGERPMELCRQVEYATGVSFRAVYNDLTRWRKTEEGFDDRYRSAVKWGLGAGGQNAVPPAWEILWLKAWEATGQPVRACDMVEEDTGFRPKYRTILNKKDPHHHSYDEAFAEKYADIEHEVLGRRVDDLFGCVQDPETAPRDRAYIDLQILERRRPDDWSRNTKTQIEGSVRHELGPSKELMARYNAIVEGRFEQRALPPEPVKIADAELVE